MPSLKQITCSVDLGPANTTLKEYGERYSDGHVETFIAAPDTDVPFTIHIKSEGYIAPGLAFFVFMDGEYQCNRNRIGLKLPGPGVQPREYETEFRVRQKEEKAASGGFVVRDWTFAKLNKAADKAPSLNTQFTRNLGTIEVIALRCKTNLDDTPLPQQIPRRPQKEENTRSSKQKANSTNPVKHISEKGPEAPRKAPAPEHSEIGGFFGLFDGACGDAQVDGAGDERPGNMKDTRRPQTRPGMVWDESCGEFLPEHLARFLPGGPDWTGSVLDMTSRPKAAGGNEHQTQLDGPVGRPSVVFNQWGAPEEDKTGRETTQRDTYERYWPETNRRTNANATAPLCNWQYKDNGAQYPNSMAHQRFQPNSRYGYPQEQAGLGGLKRMQYQRRDFVPANQNAGVQGRDAGYQYQPGPMEHERRAYQGQKPNIWMEDIIEDFEIKREHVLQLQRLGLGHVSVTLEALRRQRQKALQDPLIQRDPVDVEDYKEICKWFDERVNSFELFAQHAMEFPAVNVRNILDRLDMVRIHRDRAIVLTKDLIQRNHRVHNQVRGWHDDGRPSPTQQRAPPPPANGPDNYLENDPRPLFQKDTRNGNKLGSFGGNWQEAGGGTWRPPQQAFRNQAKGEPQSNWIRQESDFGGRKWNEERPMNNAGSNDRKGGSPDGWDDQANQNVGNFNIAASRKTSEHNLSAKGSHNASWGHVQQQSRAASQSGDGDAGWDGNKGSAGWGNNDNRSQANGSTDKDNGWSDKNDGQSSEKGKNPGLGDTPANQASKDDWRERTPNAHRSSAHHPSTERSGNPRGYIKPYWKDWNIPIGRNETSDQGKKHNAPREPYNYPVSPLPSVPEEEAKGATHGVQTGKGADYAHKCHKPIYIDTMEAPYAVFSFKYRSKEALGKTLKVKVDGIDVSKIQSIMEKKRLDNLPKHQLIEELMQTRAAQKSEFKTRTASGANKPGSAWSAQASKAAKQDGWDNAQDGNNWDKSHQGGTNGNVFDSNSRGNSKRGSQAPGDGWNRTNSNFGGGNKSGEKKGDTAGWDDTAAPAGAESGWNNQNSSGGPGW